MNTSTAKYFWIFFCLFFGIRNVQANHDLWIVDTHAASWTRPSDTDFAKIHYLQLCGNRWMPSDAATFLDTQDPEIPTVVFAPGYTATLSNNLEIGSLLLRTCGSSTPMRLVLWNWPAEKIDCGLRRDIRGKIPVATANGRYLSMLLQSMKPTSKVCLLGFSFGTRILGDAVEMLGDAKPDGMQLHLVLCGAASDQCRMASYGKNGNVPRVADRILVIYNPEDIRLKFYPLMYGRGYRPQALGKTGPPMNLISSEYRSKIEAVNINPEVGVRHKTVIHFGTRAFRCRVNSYLLFQ